MQQGFEKKPFDGAGKFSGWHWQASNQNGSSGDTAAVTDSWRYSRNRCESRELEVEHDDKTAVDGVHDGEFAGK